jgi:hypothetical protein
MRHHRFKFLSENRPQYIYFHTHHTHETQILALTDGDGRKAGENLADIFGGRHQQLHSTHTKGQAK